MLELGELSHATLLSAKQTSTLYISIIGKLQSCFRSTMLAMIKSHQTLGVNIVTDFHNTKEAREF